MNRIKEKYQNEVKGQLKERFKIINDMAVPRLKKIVINIGIGEAKDNEGVLEKAKTVLAVIAGQQPVVTKAKKSISGFKLTEGAPIGLMVTLRGDRMYSFYDKLVNIVLPKVRDFRGVSEASFDRTGNFNLGLQEQVIFPEVDDLMRHGPAGTGKDVGKLRGLQVTINTTAINNEQAKMLLEGLGMPFRKV